MIPQKSRNPGPAHRQISMGLASIYIILPYRKSLGNPFSWFSVILFYNNYLRHFRVFRDLKIYMQPGQKIASRGLIFFPRSVIIANGDFTKNIIVR